MSPLHGHSETTYSERDGHAGKGWIAGLRDAGYESGEIESMLEEGALHRILDRGAEGTTHGTHSEDFIDYVAGHGGRDTQVRVVACSRLLRGSGLKPLPPPPPEPSHLDEATQQRAASLHKLCDDTINTRLHQPLHQAGPVGVDIHYYAMRGSSPYMDNPAHVSTNEALRKAERKIEAAEVKVSADTAHRLVRDIEHIYNDAPWALHGQHPPLWDPRERDRSAARYHHLLEEEKARYTGPASRGDFHEPEDDYSPPLRGKDPSSARELPSHVGGSLSPPVGEHGSPRLSSRVLMAEMEKNALPACTAEARLPTRYQDGISHGHEAKADGCIIYRRGMKQALEGQLGGLQPGGGQRPAAQSLTYQFGPRGARPAGLVRGQGGEREPWRNPVLRNGRLL